MKKDEKKPTFEPVSVEEAKKIRANVGSTINPTSATECPSGDKPQLQACKGKSYWDECCWNSSIYGRCVNGFYEGERALYCSGTNE